MQEWEQNYVLLVGFWYNNLFKVEAFVENT